MKTTSNARSFVVAMGCLLTAIACGGKSTTGGGSDTATDWLASCDNDGDCGSGIHCACGICTTQCASDSECTSLSPRAVCRVAPEGCDERSLCVTDAFFPEQSAQDSGDAQVTGDAQAPAQESPSACDPRIGCTGASVCIAPSCDELGSCMEFGPAACDEIYAPVCGCDGLTYDNPCKLHGAPFAFDAECEATLTDAGLAQDEPLPSAGTWETDSFEDPLTLLLTGTLQVPSARVCSISLSSPSDPGIPPAEQMLAGTNCDANPSIEVRGDELFVDFVIPWPELESPIHFTMVVTLAPEEDVLSSILTTDNGSEIDLVWARVEGL